MARQAGGTRRQSGHLPRPAYPLYPPTHPHPGLGSVEPLGVLSGPGSPCPRCCPSLWEEDSTTFLVHPNPAWTPVGTCALRQGHVYAICPGASERARTHMAAQSRTLEVNWVRHGHFPPSSPRVKQEKSPPGKHSPLLFCCELSLKLSLRQSRRPGARRPRSRNVTNL